MFTLFQRLFFLLFFIAGGVFFAPSSQASLLITPLQVVFKERERTAEIVLVNTSDKTNTYRLRWEQLDQFEGEGGYVPAEDDVRKERTDLEDFAVFTPRQVTLGPNEKQTVRLAVRRPKDLPDGEYKSHLKFAIVPDLQANKGNDKEVPQDEIGIGAQVVVSYSVPVVYRVGEYNTKISIGTPEITRNPKTSNILINVSVERSGTHGAVGLMHAYYKPDGGEEYEIGALGNASLYTEINRRDFTIVTQEKNLNPGQLRITFTKAEGSVGDFVILDEKTFPVGK